MKTSHQAIIASIIIALCVLVYISKKEKQIDIPQTVATTTDIIVNESTDFYTIKAEIPSEPLDTKKIMQSDMMNIINAKREEWKTGGALYLEEQNIKAKYPDRPYIKYELNIQYDKFESKEKGMVTYVFKNYEFTGGAHGGTGLSMYTFGPNGQVAIDDIIDFKTKKGNALALTLILRDRLKASLGELYNEEMLDGGLGLQFVDKKAKPEDVILGAFNFKTNFEHFVVLDEGIRFIFGQYQVAPYAAGMPDVMLKWEELGPYLK